MGRKLLTILSFVYIISLISIPNIVDAQISPLCWTKEACEAARGDLDSDQKSEAFVSASEDSQVATACKPGYITVKNVKQELGFCLPAGKSKTEISFGGKTEFSQWGEFVKYIYRYGIIIAGIFAVIMILVGGIQYVTSGGNSEKTGAAIKRIGSSLAGLILILVSYTILHAINPALVNLRLPQVWMVNQAFLANEYCDDLSDSQMLAFAYPSGAAVTQAEKTAGVQNAMYNDNKNTAKCGNDYFVNGSNGMTCKGTSCTEEYGENHVCYKGINDEKDSCKPGNIGGVIYNSGLVDGMVQDGDDWLFSMGMDLAFEFWAWEWTNQPYLYIVCKDGYLHSKISDTKIDLTDEKKYIQEYSLTVDMDSLNEISLNEKCKNNGGYKGIILITDFNVANSGMDQVHAIGQISGNTVDLGLTIYERTLTVPSTETTEYEGNDIPVIQYFLAKANPKYFFNVQMLKKGIRLNIDAKQINNIIDFDDMDFEENKNMLEKKYAKYWQ